jgi:hypothetical protein
MMNPLLLVCRDILTVLFVASQLDVLVAVFHCKYLVTAVNGTGQPGCWQEVFSIHCLLLSWEWGRPWHQEQEGANTTGSMSWPQLVQSPCQMSQGQGHVSELWNKVEVRGLSQYSITPQFLTQSFQMLCFPIPLFHVYSIFHDKYKLKRCY